ncbi:hypothetical protein BC941DRAFT_415462 [Chlamydoabsidia padenii]|nr:hypothetical protein BC941DRAFT_415462 [Chlamydoabsidia padenii]
MDHDVQYLWVLYGLSSFVMVWLYSLIVVSGVSWSLFDSGTNFVFLLVVSYLVYLIRQGTA